MTLNSLPTLTGIRLLLRNKLPHDRQSYLETSGQPEAIWGFGGSKKDARPRTSEEADAFMQGRPGWMTWTIALVEGRRIGSISFHDILESNRRATMAIGISLASDMNKGYGTEAIKLLLVHGFGAMTLHRIDLRVLARNKRAIRAYEKCGFVSEGVEREAALIDGEWEDDVFMSILEHEFRRA